MGNMTLFFNKKQYIIDVSVRLSHFEIKSLFVKNSLLNFIYENRNSLRDFVNSKRRISIITAYIIVSPYYKLCTYGSCEILDKNYSLMFVQLRYYESS